MFSLNQLRQRLNSRGDTLVEVLLSIAIISTILSGAYIVTNKSLIASRESQERGNALKLSQGQIERIKSISSSDPAALFGTSALMDAPFCINDANAVVAATDAACKVDAEGKSTAIEAAAYELKIERATDKHTFTLTTTWPSLKSDRPNNVQLIYEVY